ncbi:MAG: gliding motility lipoprotein GldH [Bacteroidetes bacterium]|nr:gliding motility lipoprotein GldH [Bacteroidota bacterium]
MPVRILSLCLILMSFGCDSHRVYEAYEDLPKGWHKDSLVVFNFQPPDSIHRYDLFLQIRNNNLFRFSNIFLITQLEFPNGMVQTDTLEYRMANPDGSWLGTGFSDLKENKLWYKESVRFPESGNYTLNIRQAMRENGKTRPIENLKGITDVGFRIERQSLEETNHE